MASKKETEQSETHVNGNGNGAKASTPLADLMRIIGGTGRFDPLPPDQHRWQSRDVEPPKHRMWSWMIGHTVARRSPFAVDEFGHELHLNAMAKDLGIDSANVRFNWRLGAKQGLWRNGDKDEGAQRLYLKASVGDLPDQGGDQKGEEKAQEVCTNLLPASILKKTQDWPSERVRELETEWRTLQELERALHSVLVAAGRSFIGREQDNLLSRFGVKHERQKHQKQAEGEQEANRRRERGNPLLPAIENFVQSLLPKVCTDSGKSLYNGETPFVQTSIYKELEFRDLEARPSGRAESEPPARPKVVSQSPPHQNGETKTEDWRPELRDWLRENCPVKTVLDDVMFERIAFWLSPELLGLFREAALEVKNPRKWPVYESVAKQVSGRGEVPDARVSRKDQRRQEWGQELLQKFGKEA